MAKAAFARIGLVLSLATVVVASALRPLSTGSDSPIYSYWFGEILRSGAISTSLDPLFDAIAVSIAGMGGTVPVFFGVVTALILLFSIMAGVWVFEQSALKTGTMSGICLFIATILASPLYFSAENNVLRQGLSSSIVILSAIYIIDRKWIFSILLSILACGVHKSAALALISIYFASLVPKRYVISLSMLFMGLYLMGIGEIIVQIISDATGIPLYEATIGYRSDAEYRTGIRVDFVAFSVLIGLFAETLACWMRRNGYFSPVIFDISRIYWALLIPFYVFGYGAFSDRFLFNAWMLATVNFGLIAALLGPRITIGVGMMMLYSVTALYVLRVLIWAR